MHNLFARRSLIIAVCSGLISVMPGEVRGQELDVALHATDTPGEYEIGIRATEEATVGGLVNMTMTVRWEAAAGGTIEESSLLSYCPSFRPFENGEGVVTYGNYKYYTLLFESNIPVQSGCALSTVERIVARFQITGLNGCWNVDVADDYYVQTNNKDYFISVGGSSYTGSITSSPIPGGDCPPCVAPELVAFGSSGLSTCTGPLDLWVVATGTALLYTWQGPAGQLPLETQYFTPDSIHIPNALVGLYGVIVENQCGSDTASIIVSPTPCTEAPEITSISGSFVNGENCNGSLSLGATVDNIGPCPNFRWERAGVFISNVLVPSAFNGPPGQYTLIVTTVCGSDTAAVLMANDGACVPPVITSFAHGSFTCLDEPVSFTAITSGTCLQISLQRPSGVQLPFQNNADVMAEPGLYSLIVSNACGSDTMVLQLDVPDCSPPIVKKILGDTLTCNPTQLVLEADATVAECYTAVWNGPPGSNTPDGALTCTVTNPSSGTYTLTVTNACGQATASIDVLRFNTVNLFRQVCDNSPILDMQAVTGTAGDGVWTLQGVPHSSFYDPAIDSSGYYHLMDPTIPLECPTHILHVYELPYLNSGISDTAYVCSVDEPFAMIDSLGGTPDPGGIWTVGLLPALHSPLFDPAVDGTRIFRYYHDGPQFQCSNGMASLMVFETAATTWYLDADADGLGDSAFVLLSCDTIVGHVTNDSDECPLAYGTIGSPCDDELPWTTNDVLTADCTCIGDLTTDLTGTDDKSEFSIWPNPNAQGHLFIRMAQTLPGSTEIRVHNMIGEAVIVSRLPSPVDTKTYVLDVADLAVGPYQVEIRNTTTRSSARFIITR
jgi:hypothetical protein